MHDRAYRAFAGGLSLSEPIWWAGYCSLRFKDAGRDRSGVDCWGLQRLLYRDRAAIDLPLYGEIPASEIVKVAKAIAAARSGGPWSIVAGAPQELDCVLMLARILDEDGRYRAHPVHVGTMLDDRRMIHIEIGRNVVVTDVDHPLIRPRIVELYRHEKLL